VVQLPECGHPGVAESELHVAAAVAVAGAAVGVPRSQAAATNPHSSVDVADEGTAAAVPPPGGRYHAAADTGGRVAAAVPPPGGRYHAAAEAGGRVAAAVPPPGGRYQAGGPVAWLSDVLFCPHGQLS